MSLRWGVASIVLVTAALVQGCGSQTCTTIGGHTFSATLTLGAGGVPPDLTIALTYSGAGGTATYTVADILPEPPSFVKDNGPACWMHEGGMKIGCFWAAGNGAGTFTATAQGYKAVHLTFQTEGDEDDCFLGPEPAAAATLEPV